MEKDVLSVLSALPSSTALSASVPEQDPEILVAMLQQESSKKARRTGQTLRTTLPVLILFPKYLGVESKVI